MLSLLNVLLIDAITVNKIYESVSITLICTLYYKQGTRTYIPLTFSLNMLAF